MFYIDKGVVKFFYGKEKTLTSKFTFTGSFHFYIEDKNKKIILFPNKLYNNNNELTEIETNNLIILGNWLLDVSNLDPGNIYLYIKLKSINNEEFLNWWNNNFQIKIKESNFDTLLKVKEFF